MLRQQLYVPTESSFPIPVKDTDVVRETKTKLDNLEGSIGDDAWNIDATRTLRKLKRTHVAPHPQRAPTRGFSWVDGRLIDTQVTSRPETI